MRRRCWWLGLALALLAGCGTVQQGAERTPPSIGPTAGAIPSPIAGSIGQLVELFAVTDFGPGHTPTPAGAQPVPVALPGTAVPTRALQHVPDGAPLAYDESPPTSGASYDGWLEFGIYAYAPSDGWLMSSLAHGGVIISYDPTRISAAELEQLYAQARTLSARNPRIVVVPRAPLPGPVTLTAWGYLLPLERYDPAAVEAFYQAHIARGPECVEGRCPAKT